MRGGSYRYSDNQPADKIAAGRQRHPTLVLSRSEYIHLFFLHRARRRAGNKAAVVYIQMLNNETMKSPAELSFQASERGGLRSSGTAMGNGISGAQVSKLRYGPPDLLGSDCPNAPGSSRPTSQLNPCYFIDTMPKRNRFDGMVTSSCSELVGRWRLHVA